MSAKTSGAGLLDLPIELREEIYGINVREENGRRAHMSAATGKRCSLPFEDVRPLALALVNRQIRGEFLPALMREYTYELVIDPTSPFRPWTAEFFRSPSFRWLSTCPGADEMRLGPVEIRFAQNQGLPEAHGSLVLTPGRDFAFSLIDEGWWGGPSVQMAVLIYYVRELLEAKNGRGLFWSDIVRLLEKMVRDTAFGLKVTGNGEAGENGDGADWNQ